MDFDSFDFHPSIESGIQRLGYETATPIQEKAIPPALDGKDVMGLAQTGTGKTAAFVLPILEHLIHGKGKGKIKALVLAPTRELAEQTHDSFVSLGGRTKLRFITVYGGVRQGPQVQRIERGVDIVIACPGRLLDLMNQKVIDLSNVEILVLDEADRMFDMGFMPDVRRITKQTPKGRQTLLFSATMPEDIRKLSHEILRNPVTVQIEHTKPLETVSHALYPVPAHLKTGMLKTLLKTMDTGPVLVFTRTKHKAKRVASNLVQAGYKSTSLQGNLTQGQRQTALNGFKSGKYQILVATDIAARGIDVSNISHVINYDIPATPDDYTHRIGRTGRATKTGDAFTFVTSSDEHIVKSIEKILGSKIERRMVDDFDYNKPKPPTPEGHQQSRPRHGGGRQRQGGSNAGKPRSGGGGHGGGHHGGGGKPRSGGGHGGGHHSSKPRSSGGGHGGGHHGGGQHHGSKSQHSGGGHRSDGGHHGSKPHSGGGHRSAGGGKPRHSNASSDRPHHSGGHGGHKPHHHDSKPRSSGSGQHKDYSSSDGHYHGTKPKHHQNKPQTSGSGHYHNSKPGANSSHQYSDRPRSGGGGHHHGGQSKQDKRKHHHSGKNHHKGGQHHGGQKKKDSGNRD